MTCHRNTKIQLDVVDQLWFLQIVNLKDCSVVVNEELGHLIGIAWRQVGEEGRATGRGDDA